jgi:hypothetical protein
MKKYIRAIIVAGTLVLLNQFITYAEDYKSADSLVIDTDENWNYYAYQDGSPAPGGWYKEETWQDVWEREHTTWMYVLPNSGGKILQSSWILDNGLVYCTASSGITASDKAVAVRDAAAYGDVIYNVQANQFEALPYTLDSTHYVFVDCNGATTYDKFLYSISGQSYAEWTKKTEQQNNDYENQKANLNNETNWSIANSYIGQAMSEAGYFNYEVIQKCDIEPYFNGGFTATYKVKVPQSGSSHTGYLRIVVNADGTYFRSEF